MTDRDEASRRVPAPRRVSAIEAAAAAVSLAWIGLNAWALWAAGSPVPAPPDAMAPARAGVAIALPLLLLWAILASARTARTLRAENARLRAALARTQETLADRQRAAISGLRRTTEERIAEIAGAQAELRAEMAALREELRAPADAARVLAPEAFIRAFDLPRDAEDDEGFRALRAALDNPVTGPLVTATQDLLTLLAQDGIHAGALTVVPADAVLWRALAEGTRGAAVAALGGVRDRSSLALVRGRLQEDAVFRDTARHFLRTFVHVYAGFAAKADDDDLRRFADTRTARAFMLTGGAAGLFD